MICRCGKQYPPTDLHKVCPTCNTYIGMPVIKEERWQSNQQLINEIKAKDNYIQELEGQIEIRDLSREDLA